MKDVVKIVLTGGPCAGKTTALSWISNHFTKIGWKVLIVNEIATELMTAGIYPGDFENPLDFQKLLVHTQIRKEKNYENYVAPQLKDSEKILIVCDRGVRDNQAYMTKEEYNRVIDCLPVSYVFNSYDGVFHLVTAADGAEEFYTLANNAARSETIEEARALDRKTQNAWVGCDHFRIIKNEGTFEDKLRKLLSEISILLGEPEPYEIERKYLIKKPDLGFLGSLANVKKVDILQTYLISENNTEVRVRQRSEDGKHSFTKTTKRHTDDPAKRIEEEKRISEDEYLGLLMDADPELHPVRKNRYCIAHRESGQYLEVDIYPTSSEYAILEVELPSVDTEVVIPDYLEVVKEVTDDLSFSNYAIAKNLGKLPEPEEP